MTIALRYWPQLGCKMVLTDFVIPAVGSIRGTKTKPEKMLVAYYVYNIFLTRPTSKTVHAFYSI